MPVWLEVRGWRRMVQEELEVGRARPCRGHGKDFGFSYEQWGTTEGYELGEYFESRFVFWKVLPGWHVENGSEGVANPYDVLCHIPLSPLISAQLRWMVPCTIASVPLRTCAGGSLYSAFSWAVGGCSSVSRYNPEMPRQVGPNNEGRNEWIDAPVSPSSGATILRTLYMGSERIPIEVEPQLPTAVSSSLANIYCFLPSLPSFLLYSISVSYDCLPNQLSAPKCLSQVCFGGI